MTRNSAYQAPRLVFADENIAKIYAEKYPEVEKMMNSMKIAPALVATLDLATAVLDINQFDVRPKSGR